MSAVDDFKSDALKLTASYYARPVLAGLLVLSFGFCSYVRGRRSVVTDQKIAAAVDTVRITEQVRAAAAETVTVQLKAQRRIDTLVRVLDDTLMVFRRDTLHVPPVVVERIVTDDKTIRVLTNLVVADSSVIRSLHHLLELPKPVRHWGLGASVGYACNQKGCGPGLSVGLAWRF